MPHFIQATCTSCGDCENACPTDSIVPTRTQFAIDTDTCEDCCACVPLCKVQAITATSNPAAPLKTP